MAEEFGGQFECLEEDTQKLFLVPIKKEFQNRKTITYKTKFIDRFRFMPSSLSSLVDNLAEGIYKNKCTVCKSCLKYIEIEKHINKDLIKRFENTYEFCNGDISKFFLMLRKGIYPYKYMNSWERFSESSLPEKEDIYSNLNMKDITDADYMHA